MIVEFLSILEVCNSETSECLFSSGFMKSVMDLSLDEQIMYWGIILESATQ